MLIISYFLSFIRLILSEKLKQKLILFSYEFLSNYKGQKMIYFYLFLKENVKRNGDPKTLDSTHFLFERRSSYSIWKLRKEILPFINFWMATNVHLPEITFRFFSTISCLLFNPTPPSPCLPCILPKTIERERVVCVCVSVCVSQRERAATTTTKRG